MQLDASNLPLHGPFGGTHADRLRHPQDAAKEFRGGQRTGSQSCDGRLRQAEQGRPTYHGFLSGKLSGPRMR